MARSNRFSLAHQPLDQASFLAYFLGAVVPLVALVFVTQRYLDVAPLAPGMGGGTLFRSRPFLIGLIVSIAVLSLASFLALRRTVRRALARAEVENRRLLRQVEKNEELQDDQRNFFIHVTHLTSRALNAHLGYHGDHASNVAHLSVRIGRALRLDRGRLERLHFAALLHDIGMLAIDVHHLEDKRAMRKHPEIGAEMLESIAFWQDLAPFVEHHHEWWDGSGYPAGLAAEEIPLESRIIGLAEAFDSMTNAAGYKPAVEVAVALERIERNSGVQFDPELASRFAELAREGPLLPD